MKAPELLEIDGMHVVSPRDSSRQARAVIREQVKRLANRARQEYREKIQQQREEAARAGEKKKRD
jgi:hypothetical protein